MIKTLISRIKQGYRTNPYPIKPHILPERFLGRPCVFPKDCKVSCGKCREVCPTGAISGCAESLSLDMGKCLFCGECQKVCESKAVTFTREYSLSSLNRDDLIIKDKLLTGQVAVRKRIKSIFGRSLKLRQVSAGGCNACELDINVLNTIGFDLGRFGIQFVASPRHADGIVVTGPVTKNMRLALEKTYKAVPAPKLVIAVGTCAVSGGPYSGHEEVCDGAGSVIPVDVFIPGCPPNPWTILDGLLKAVGREK